MSHYKALITDIDNTLVPVKSDGSEITASLCAAIKLAQSQGKLIATASGRGWHSTKPVVHKLGITSPCIIEGGARIIDPVSEKILWERLIAQEVCNEVIAIFKENAQTNELLKTSTSEVRVPIQAFGLIEQDTSVLYLLGTDEATANKIVALVENITGVVAHKTTPSWVGDSLFDVHVTNPMGTKEHAIAQWQTMFKVAKEATIGIGDSENDIPLFNAAGFKVAVGNATKGLKERADFIAPSQSDGGVEAVLTQFLIDT